MLIPSVGIQATLDFNDSVPNKRPVLCTVSHIYFFRDFHRYRFRNVLYEFLSYSPELQQVFITVTS